MAIHVLKSIQKIPASLEDVWSFFSTPVNLQQITPDNMDFKIISGDHDTSLYNGQLFEYKVSPILNIPLYWKTEITRVEPMHQFTDLQVKGPYKLWEHSHYFKKINNGVEMMDLVYYEIPFWLMGGLANALFIKNRLRQIFTFRYRKVEELFGKWPEEQEVSIEIKKADKEYQLLNGR